MQQDLGEKEEIARTLNNIGIIHVKKGRFDLGMDYYNRSFSLHKEAGNKQEMGNTLNNIGVIYWQRGDLDKSHEYHMKSLKIREEIGNKLFCLFVF